MRRLLGIILLLLFSLPSVSPLLALTAPARELLPACCRRAGVHQCSLKAHQAASAARAQANTGSLAPVGETCPLFPATLPTVIHGDTLAAPPQALLFAELLSHPATRPQTEAHARIALGRSRQKRGPPTPSTL